MNLRDALRCRACGRGPRLRETYHRGFGYHHVIARSHGGPDEVENLLLLCQACHDDHHHGRREFSFGPQCPPEGFACHGCGASVDPGTVPMNCGWYACPHCRQRTHLFDHFGFASDSDAD